MASHDMALQSRVLSTLDFQLLSFVLTIASTEYPLPQCPTSPPLHVPCNEAELSAPTDTVVVRY